MIATNLTLAELAQKFNYFQSTIQFAKSVCIGYTDKDGVASGRIICPTHFHMSQAGNLSVRAYCTMRGEYRTFCLAQITSQYVVEGLARPADMFDEKHGVDAAL